MGDDTDRDLPLQVGWLLLRIGFGAFFMAHGIPKLFGGVGAWAGLGGAMGTLGIGFAPAFWGFCAAVAESVGGFLILVGLCVRPAAALMLVTMLVATWMHISKGDGFTGFSHAAESAVVFLALLVGGAGRFGALRLCGPSGCRGRRSAGSARAVTPAGADHAAEHPTETAPAPVAPAAGRDGGG